MGLDAAGTLIRPREPVGESYARIARAHGVALPAWRLEDAFRRALRAAAPMVFPGEAAQRVRSLERGWSRGVVRAAFHAADQSARFADFDAFFDELFQHYAAPAAWIAAADAGETLRRLRTRGGAGGRRVAVFSNFDHRLPSILRGLGLDAIDLVLLPGDLGVAKPDPRFFAAAAARLGVAPGEALYVGNDPEQDLGAARRAGWWAVDVASLATLGELPARIAALEARGGDAAAEEPAR